MDVENDRALEKVFTFKHGFVGYLCQISAC